MKYIIKPILWLGELAIVTMVLLPFSLFVYASLNLAFLLHEGYQWIKR